MKFFRLDLLTLLISLFIFNSCKNQDAIGLGVSSRGNQLSSNLIDTSTIVINTVPEDSTITSSITKKCLTYFVDPFWYIESPALQLILIYLAATAYTLPTGTILP